MDRGFAWPRNHAYHNIAGINSCTHHVITDTRFRFQYVHSNNETLFFHVRLQIARMQPSKLYREWAEAHGAVAIESVGAPDMPAMRCMCGSSRIPLSMPCRFWGPYRGHLLACAGLLLIEILVTKFFCIKLRNA